MSLLTSASRTPRTLEEVSAPQFVPHFKPIANSLLLPRAPFGTYWEGKPRVPDLPICSHFQITKFEKTCLIQYRGSCKATAIANSGAIHDTAEHLIPHFCIKQPHPLTQCVTFTYETTKGGLKKIIKSHCKMFTTTSDRQRDKKLKVQEKHPEPTSKPDTEGTEFSTEFSNSPFDRIDKKIGHLVQRILPNMPHLLSVPTHNPYLSNFPYENRNTPFEDFEIKKLQHMTLISSGNRGVAWARGDWEDELNVMSPHSAAQSGVGTPLSERDPSKPVVKMSLKDYKAGKRPTGSSYPARSAPSLNAPDGHNGVAELPVSPTQQMIDQIIEGSASKMTDRFREREHIPHPDTVRPPPPPPKKVNSPPYNWDPGPLPSQYLPKPERQAERGRVVWPPSNVPEWKEKLQSRATQPSSPPPPASHTQQPKRPHDTAETSRPEKRAKLDQASEYQGSIQHNVASLQNSNQKTHLVKDIPRKSATSGIIADENQRYSGQLKSDESAVKPSVKPTKNAPHAQVREKLPNGSYKEGGPTDAMPPLLSPLPASITSPTDGAGLLGNEPVKEQKSDVVVTPSTKKSTIDEAASPEHSRETKSAQSYADDFELPPLLSPLPDWLLEGISREKEEMARLGGLPATTTSHANSHANTVGARRERSRQPDTPGVARKSTKAHPAASTVAKGSAGEATSSVSAKAGRKIDGPGEKTNSGGGSRGKLIVKLKYGKRNKIAIGRILNMTARPDAEHKHLHPAPATSHSSEGKNATAGTQLEGKKHARHADESEEPSSKRSKASASHELQRARTPLTPSVQSPAASAPSAQPTAQKTTFSTPKRGDAMKSVAMRKVDSNEGRVFTPQGGSTSAPASVEKARTNGNDSKSAESDAFRATHTSYATLGTALKRQADQVLKVKEANPGPVSEDDRKLGAVIALESVTAYMVSFHAYDMWRQVERRSNTGDNWTQFFAFLAFAVERSKQYKELYTVALLLSAVCREALEQVYTDRMNLDPTCGNPNYLKDFSRNSRARAGILYQYQEQNKIFPVDFAISVSDAKVVAISVLGAFCAKNDIAWEKKVEF